MDYLRLCDSDYRFMLIVWEHAPVNSGELVKLCNGKSLQRIPPSKSFAKRGISAMRKRQFLFWWRRRGCRRMNRSILSKEHLAAPFRSF